MATIGSLTVTDIPIDSALDPVAFDVPMGSGQVVSSVTVTLTLTHTFNADFAAVLNTPYGAVELVRDEGGSGDGMTGVTFSSTASGPPDGGDVIVGGTYAITGKDDWDALVQGQSSDGDWSLEIWDQYGGDVGVLDSFVLTIKSPPEHLAHRAFVSLNEPGSDSEVPGGNFFSWFNFGISLHYGKVYGQGIIYPMDPFGGEIVPPGTVPEKYRPAAASSFTLWPSILDTDDDWPSFRRPDFDYKSYQATAHPDGSITLDEPLPDAVTDPVLEAQLALNFAFAEWVPAGLVAAEPAEGDLTWATWPRFGAGWVNVDAEFAIHKNRMHLRGSVQLTDPMAGDEFIGGDWPTWGLPFVATTTKAEAHFGPDATIIVGDSGESLYLNIDGAGQSLRQSVVGYPNELLHPAGLDLNNPDAAANSPAVVDWTSPATILITSGASSGATRSTYSEFDDSLLPPYAIDDLLGLLDDPDWVVVHVRQAFNIAYSGWRADSQRILPYDVPFSGDPFTAPPFTNLADSVTVDLSNGGVWLDEERNHAAGGILEWDFVHQGYIGPPVTKYARRGAIDSEGLFPYLWDPADLAGLTMHWQVNQAARRIITGDAPDVVLYPYHETRNKALMPGDILTFDGSGWAVASTDVDEIVEIVPNPLLAVRGHGGRRITRKRVSGRRLG